jgi:ATP-dependent RNA helicase DHX29
MGKKPSAKKKGKGPDLRGYATVSVASAKKTADEEAELEQDDHDISQVDAAAEQEANASSNAPGGDREDATQDEDDGLEDWERAEEREEIAAKAKAAPAQTTAQVEDSKTADVDEDWDKAIESRLDEELHRLEKKVSLADLTAQLERRTGSTPAGVVVINDKAEQKVCEALDYLRDSEGEIHMTFPKNWRYKGKITYERLNGTYLALEALNFKGEQIRRAMEKTLGHDMRATIEYLLVNLQKEELPRQFGGESQGDLAQLEAEDDTVAATAAVQTPAPENLTNGNHKVAEEEEKLDVVAESSPDASAEKEDSKLPEPEEPIADKAAGTAKALSEEDEKKRWLMQYVEGSDSEDDELMDPEERLDRERRQDPTARYIKVLAEQDSLLKICKQLKDKKKSGSFKQNISADMQKQKQASEKLRIVQTELEQLRAGKYGKVDLERVTNHKPSPAPRSAVPKPKPPAKQEQREDATEETGAADDELPSLFGEELNAQAQEAGTVIVQVPCREYGIAGWGGRTPKQTLDEFVRKRIFGKQCPDNLIVYEKLQSSSHGRFRCAAKVHQPRAQPTKRFDPEEPCLTLRDAENLAATYALWKLSDEADHPGLSRGLPLSFKDRWREWKEEAAQIFREGQRELVKARVEFVEGLLRTKPTKAAVAISAAAVQATNCDHQDEGNAEPSRDEDFTDLSHSEASKLRAAFSQRQDALSADEEFQSIQAVRSQLPVTEYRQTLVRTIAKNPVTVVCGATGSGKTTQVPQCVLQEALEFGTDDSLLPNIIVTEPRRISAVSVAKRVSQEMGDPSSGPGSRSALVGYQIRLERRISEATRLLFCTVGVLLRKMQSSATALARVTHVFVDEVHERSAETDLLILLLRQMRHSRPDLRIIVMSATLEVEKLIRYFGQVPVINVPGKMFPVEAYFMEDCIELSGYSCDAESEFHKRGWHKDWTRTEKFQVSSQKGKTTTLTEFVDDDKDWGFDDEAEACDPASYSDYTMETLARMDHMRINLDLIEATLEYIENSEKFSHVPRHEGAVLVFLPGMSEITKLHERLLRSPIWGNTAQTLVISLHSVLSGEEHTRAFDRPRRGVRKIVLSTNIAETGVTIPDIVFVIDSGKVKSQSYHEPSNTSSLKEQFISKAETIQRRGRAGRVREGFAFHLVTRRRFDLRLHEMPTPEILRCSLMELMLSVLSSGLQPGCFSEALDPPPKSRIDQAIMTLKATGAVEEGPRPTTPPQWAHGMAWQDEAWYVVTPLGQCLARMPCDVRLGKMVLLAALFGSIESVWTIAATLSHRTPLVQPFLEHKRAQAMAVHRESLLPKDYPPSDHFALNTAYKSWEEARKGRGADTFCKKLWLSGSVLQTIRDIRNDFAESVRGDGFCEKFDKSEVPTQELNSPLLVAALMFAGLYPNIARIDTPKTLTEKAPLLSSGSEQVRLHPGSLCHGRIEGLHRTNHRWICYHTKLKTSQVFLRDATFLTPNALLLFGGEPSSLNIHPVEKSISIGVGSERHWQVLYVAPRSAALLRQLRVAFDSLLRRKAASPQRPLSKADRAIIIAYIATINSADCE